MSVWPIFCLLLALKGTDCHSVIEFFRRVTVESVTIRYDNCPEDWLQELLVVTPLPVILQSLHFRFEQEVTSGWQVICLRSEYKLEWLEQLKGRKKIFFYLQNFSSTKLITLLKDCHQMKMQQVMALPKEKRAKDIYFTYSLQTHFKLEQLSLETFAKRDLHYPNMQGDTLLVMPDQWHPRSMVYVDRKTGKQILAGSVGRFVGLLAWKLNASMEFPSTLEPGQVLHPNEVLELSRTLSVDVPVSMTLATKPEHILSYPFELTHICLMIPLSQQVPLREIYRLLASVQNVLISLAIVYGYGFFLAFHHYLREGKVAIIDCLLNDRALRGLLGQSFNLNPRSLSLKAVYFTLSIMGLNLSCIYEAALGTMLTHPPKYFQPRNVEDLQRSRLRMAINEADVTIAREMHLPLHLVNGSEFTRLRDNFNISHVYLASRLHWTLFSQQQRYFDKELFLYSMDACLSTLTLMTFPLEENSWYAEPISRLNLAVRANGIYQYFVGMHYYDMAAAGLLDFKDLSENQRPDDRHGVTLNLDDFKWISYAYVVLILLAFLLLALELLWKRCSK